MLSPLNMWNKIGRIIARIAEREHVSIEQATDMFYTSRTCANLHDPQMDLYLMPDEYVVDAFSKR